MKNKYFETASELALPVPAGTKAGDPVKIGSLIGVCATDEGAGGNIAGYASVELGDHAYTLDVDGAVSGPGTPVYIVAADNSLTTTATGNTLFGHTVPKADGGMAAKATGVGPIIVKLAQV